MADFDFDGSAVLELIEHAAGATAHYMTMDQRYEQFGTFDVVSGEEKWAPAGLWFVKDQGVYLMSNSHPKRLGPVYARGYGAQADWHAVQAAAGGDDFVEFIRVGDGLKAALTRGADLWIELSETHLAVGVIEPVRVPRVPQRGAQPKGLER